jgi:hypothetical protein
MSKYFYEGILDNTDWAVIYRYDLNEATFVAYIPRPKA